MDAALNVSIVCCNLHRHGLIWMRIHLFFAAVSCTEELLLLNLICHIHIIIISLSEAWDVNAIIHLR
jgi:hypothetical protein